MRTVFKLTLAYVMAFLFIMFGAPLLAFAQEVVVAPVTDLDFLGKVLAFFTEYKGLTSLSLAAAVVQLLILFLNAPISGKLFAKLDGGVKLLLVSLFSIIGGILAQRIAGISFGEAFWSAANLAAVQVFLHQVYLKFFAPKV